MNEEERDPEEKTEHSSDSPEALTGGNSISDTAEKDPDLYEKSEVKSPEDTQTAEAENVSPAADTGEEIQGKQTAEPLSVYDWLLIAGGILAVLLFLFSVGKATRIWLRKS